VVALVATLVGRLNELVPQLAPLRPVLLLSTFGLAALFARSSPERREAMFRDPTLRLVLAYLVWAACTVPFALWRREAVNSMLPVVSGTLLVTAILLLPSANAVVSRIVSALVASTAIYTVALLMWGSEVVDERRQLGGGGTLAANELAALEAMAFPFALGLAMRTSGRRRAAALAAAGLLVLGITATGSRGGTLAVTFGALVYMLGHRGRTKFLILLALVGGGAVAAVVAPPTYRERIAALLRGEKDYNYTDFGGRKQVWARGVGYFLEHPVVGVGTGNFDIAEGENLRRLGIRGKWSAPHNAYLEAFVDLGLPGGLLFLGLWLLTFGRASRYWSPSAEATRSGRLHRPELLAATCALGVSAYFLSMAYSYTLFGLLGIVALSDQRQRAVHAPQHARAGAGSGRTPRIPVQHARGMGSIQPPRAPPDGTSPRSAAG
jgi:O-antigen ligase